MISSAQRVKIVVRLLLLAVGATFVAVATRAIGASPLRGHGCCDHRVNNTCGNATDGAGTFPVHIAAVYSIAASAIAWSFARYDAPYTNGDGICNYCNGARGGRGGFVDGDDG